MLCALNVLAFAIMNRKETGYLLKKGKNFTLTVEKPEVDLTPAMIQR